MVPVTASSGDAVAAAGFFELRRSPSARLLLVWHCHKHFPWVTLRSRRNVASIGRTRLSKGVCKCVHCCTCNRRYQTVFRSTFRPSSTWPFFCCNFASSFCSALGISCSSLQKPPFLRNKQEKRVVPRGHTRMAVTKQGQMNVVLFRQSKTPMLIIPSLLASHSFPCPMPSALGARACLRT